MFCGLPVFDTRLTWLAVECQRECVYAAEKVLWPEFLRSQENAGSAHLVARTPPSPRRFLPRPFSQLSGRGQAGLASKLLESGIQKGAPPPPPAPGQEELADYFCSCLLLPRDLI